MNKVISTDKAPGAIGPYSQAIVANDTLYTSGQIPIIPLFGAVRRNRGVLFLLIFLPLSGAGDHIDRILPHHHMVPSDLF